MPSSGRTDQSRLSFGPTGEHHANDPQVDVSATMGQMMALERHMQLREELPDMAMLDIHFTEAVGDLETVVQRAVHPAPAPLSFSNTE